MSLAPKSSMAKATSIIAIQTVLLVISLGAMTLGVSPQIATLVLVAAFGVGTALLVSRVDGLIVSPAANASKIATMAGTPDQVTTTPYTEDLEKRVQALAEGDLAAQVAVVPGPLASLAVALNGATATLSQLARNGHETAATLVVAGAEIERSTQAVSGGANRQISAMIDVGRRLQALVLRCEEISQVVEVLDDLARQTNVLALNAALEASRAGPSGKGFAMVAEEVRKLSERSAAATKDVGAFVQTLESGAVEASRSLDELQTLTRSLADGAAGTAAVSAELMNAAKRLTQTLNRLQVDAPVENAVRSLVAGPSVEIKDLIAVLRPLVSEGSTPLDRAITTLIQTSDEANASNPTPPLRQ